MSPRKVSAITPTRWLVPHPGLDDFEWPTLGPQVVDFIEGLLVHGPGDLLGEDVHLTDEEVLHLYRAYEVFPRGHPLAGRRRFKRVCFSRRKGVGKTELAQFVGIAELDPEGPVRCDGWRKESGAWVPVGRAVRDPYIPMLAYTREQSEDLAYAGVKAILEHDRCGLVNFYDTSDTRITHIRAPGKMVSRASAPSARDGARTSWQHFDEPHRMDTERLVSAHETMLNNIPKRVDADAWSYETTTSPVPDGGSVADSTMKYALAIAEGRIADAELFFDHRQASRDPDFDDDELLTQLVVEASGDALAYSDVRSIVGLTRAPKCDRNEWTRVWLNRPKAKALSWVDLEQWDRRRHRRLLWPRRGVDVVLAFAGSQDRSSTALVGATVAPRPHLFVVATWEAPPDVVGWRTSRREVDAEVHDAFERWEVLELAPDPPGWNSLIEDWELEWEAVVVRFPTAKPLLFGPACELLFYSVMGDDQADGDVDDEIETVEFTHDGDDTLRRHLEQASPLERNGHVVIVKDAPDSERHVTAARAAVVALRRATWRFAHPPVKQHHFAMVV